jgi:hypothetical protein
MGRRQDRRGTLEEVLEIATRSTAEDTCDAIRYLLGREKPEPPAKETKR